VRENVTYELEDKDGCPNCHHQISLWLGFSGVDNDGVHLAYRCPQCGFETCDFTPDVDDVVPDRIAWRREPDGVITWYSIERAEQSVHLTAFGAGGMAVNPLQMSLFAEVSPAKHGGM